MFRRLAKHQTVVQVLLKTQSMSLSLCVLDWKNCTVISIHIP